MNYISSITSQGQLTIPKKLRDKYGIHKSAQAFISDTGSGFLVRTYTDDDFLKLKGILKNHPIVKRNKGKQLQQIIDGETKAAEIAIANNAAGEMGLPPLKK